MMIFRRRMNKTLIMLLKCIILILVRDCFGKEIDSKTDLLQEESSDLMAEHRTAQVADNNNNNQEANSNDLWPNGRVDVPQIKNINVKCEKNHMKVNIDFDRPFYGIIFSKGHYNDAKCVHLQPGSGHLVTNFDIFLGACGMTSNDQSIHAIGRPGTGLSIENTLVIQYDPQVQEIWDQARRLRCTWYDFYEKSVSFRPFNVDMMDAVTANFLGDNIQCWMQIQAGKGPWASEVTGIVKIGQTMTMVLAIKDDEGKFDMLVRNCVAHDGKNQPIQLVDDSGCVQRPKIISKFQKVKNFGSSASVVSYAYFQAFKFPDSMNVHFQCVIQVCRYECPEPKCPNNVGGVPVDDELPQLPPSGQQHVHHHHHPHHLPHEANPSSQEQFTHVNPREPQREESRLAIEHKKLVAPLIDPSKVTILKIPAGFGTHFATASSNTMFMKRHGIDGNQDKDEDTISRSSSINGTRNSVLSVGGKPRSLVSPKRYKRQTPIRPTYTDIKTGKIISVVAPGDIEFSGIAFDDESRSLVGLGDELAHNLLCMSTTSFLSSLVTVLTVLCLSSIIAVFFYLRVRALTKSSELTRNSENHDPKMAPPIATYHFPR